MKTLGSVAAVVDAVQADVQAELERLERESRQEMERLEREAPPESSADRELRVGAARREAREILAREDAADRRGSLEARERWMRRAVEEGERTLRSETDETKRRKRLLFWAEEALHELFSVEARPGSAGYEVVVSQADVPLLDAAFHVRLAAATGLPTDALATAASETFDGGCVVRTRDGRVSFDNSVAARARRLESAWRPALAAIYEP